MAEMNLTQGDDSRSPYLPQGGELRSPYGEQPQSPYNDTIVYGGGQPHPEDGQYKENQQFFNPQFNPNNVRERPSERMDCIPQYIASPWAVLRFLELALGITVLCCFTVTCNSSACVVYMNEFGRVAEGLGYCVFASMLTIVLLCVLIVMYCTNMHRAQVVLVSAMERGIFGFMIFLLLIEAIVLSYYASASADDMALYDMARAKWGGIQGAWIAGAVSYAALSHNSQVLCWVNVVVHTADLIGQCAFGYPSERHVNS